MKTLNISVFLLTALFMSMLFSSEATAGRGHYHERDRHFNHNRPSPIDMAGNPESINGTYKVEHIQIKLAKNNIIDSDDREHIWDIRGELSLNLSIEKNINVNSSYKAQILGESFMKGKPLEEYSFIYDKLSYELPHKSGTTISNSLSEIGMNIYSRRVILWEIPLKKGGTIIFTLKKTTDYIRDVDNIPYTEY